MLKLKLLTHLSQLDILSKMYSKHLISVEYINTILGLKGKKISEITKATDLYEYDQDHFFGIEATESCIKLINIKSDDYVLDIGSGFGGPARFISEQTGAKVVGIEIQNDRYLFSKQFTSSVGLSDKVDFILGDFNDLKLKDESFSKVISFLSILHIIQKKKALRKACHVLKKNGLIYIEDYYRMRNLSNIEKEKMLDTISCPNLLLKSEYYKELEKNGVSIDSEVEMTNEWSLKASTRYQTMLSELDKSIIVYGHDKAYGALEFSKGVSELFNNNIIKGFKIVGRKK